MPNATSPSDERIPIASDHAGPDLKRKVIETLKQYSFDDLGVSNLDSVDYPDYAEKVSKLVSEGRASRGILICGTGIGMSIAANKYPGIRAAVVESVEAARLSRDHNDANVLCVGARIVDEAKAIEIVRTWLATPFSQGPRHRNRIKKIADIEHKHCS